MAIEQLFRITVLLVLCQMLYGAVGQQCTPEKAETSILGMMLRRHVYKRITGVEYGHVCLLDCYQDVRCQSFNYVISQYMCELNNRTKEARPEDYVPDSDRYYFGREQNRGNFLQQNNRMDIFLENRSHSHLQSCLKVGQVCIRGTDASRDQRFDWLDFIQGSLITSTV